VDRERELLAFAPPRVSVEPYSMLHRVTFEQRGVDEKNAVGEAAMVFARFNAAGRGDAPGVEEVQRTLRSSAFSDQLDELRGTLQEGLDLDRTITVSVAGVSLGLSLLYVVWLIRGGVLMGSYLSALPAWRVLDPLPVLSRVDEDAEQDDDEALDGAREQGGDPLRGFG
jgi:hypothetical protein